MPELALSFRGEDDEDPAAVLEAASLADDCCSYAADWPTLLGLKVSVLTSEPLALVR